jgi:hypothetical protein
MNSKLVFKVLLLCVVSGIVYAAPTGMPGEITKVHEGVKGYMEGISYLVGTGSSVVGVWKFVESQSLKAVALAASVTIVAFKFPGWVVAAAVI